MLPRSRDAGRLLSGDARAGPAHHAGRQTARRDRARVSPTGNPNPTPDVALRFGLADRVDLGLRLRMKAVEIGPKIQLVRDAVEVSIAPAFLAAADEDHTFDETTTPDDNVSVIASRTSVYVGTNAAEPVSAFIAPTLDVGQRRFRDAEVGGTTTCCSCPAC